MQLLFLLLNKEQRIFTIKLILTVCLWNTVSRTLNWKSQMFLLFIPALCHCLATSQNFSSPHEHFLPTKNVFKMDRLCTGVELSLLNVFMANWFYRHLWKWKPLQFIPSLTRELNFAGLSAQALPHRVHFFISNEYCQMLPHLAGYAWSV